MNALDLSLNELCAYKCVKLKSMRGFRSVQRFNDWLLSVSLSYYCCQVWKHWDLWMCWGQTNVWKFRNIGIAKCISISMESTKCISIFVSPLVSFSVPRAIFWTNIKSLAIAQIIHKITRISTKSYSLQEKCQIIVQSYSFQCRWSVIFLLKIAGSSIMLDLLFQLSSLAMRVSFEHKQKCYRCVSDQNRGKCIVATGSSLSETMA